MHPCRRTVRGRGEVIEIRELPQYPCNLSQLLKHQYFRPPIPISHVWKVQDCVENALHPHDISELILGYLYSTVAVKNCRWIVTDSGKLLSVLVWHLQSSQ